MLEQIIAFLIANWSFIAVAFILGLVGEVVKSIVIGDDKEKAKKNKWKSLFLKTIPLHPVLGGAFLGLILSAAIPDLVATGGVASSMLYFAASGALSTWLYAAFKSVAPTATKAIKKKIANSVGQSSPEEE